MKLPGFIFISTHNYFIFYLKFKFIHDLPFSVDVITKHRQDHDDGEFSDLTPPENGFTFDIFSSIFIFAASTAHKSAPTVKQPKTSSSSDSGDDSDHEESESSQNARKTSRTIVAMRRPSIMAAAALKNHHYGSFYLRMGAVGEFQNL